MIPQLLIDMAENWCMWQIALGDLTTAQEQAFRVLNLAKVPLLFSAGLYALVVSILVWIKKLPR